MRHLNLMVTIDAVDEITLEAERGIAEIEAFLAETNLVAA